MKRGDVWAYKETWARGPLVPVRIVDPGTHYDADIKVRRLDDPAAPEIWTRRNRLPCRWTEADAYLEAHPEIVRREDVIEDEATDTQYQAAAEGQVALPDAKSVLTGRLASSCRDEAERPWANGTASCLDTVPPAAGKDPN